MEEKKNNSRIRLGITQGDINGISYEVILKTFSDSRMFDICTPILYGSTKVASYHKKLLQLHQDIAFNAIHNAQEAGDKRFYVINLTNDEIKIDVGEQQWFIAIKLIKKFADANPCIAHPLIVVMSALCLLFEERDKVALGFLLLFGNGCIHLSIKFLGVVLFLPDGPNVIGIDTRLLIYG